MPKAAASPKKITKNSKKPLKRSTKHRTWQDTLFEKGRMRLKPILEEDLEEYGNKWIEFCQQQVRANDLRSDTPLPFYLEDFLAQEGIPYPTLVEWRKRSDYLEGCIQFGFNNLLGVHQERGAAVRRFSEKTIHIGLHHYLPRWKAAEKYQSDLRKDEEPAPTKVIVNMKDYSNA